LEVEQLGHDEVRDLVVHGQPEEDDPLVQEPREDVVLALPSGAALDDGGDEGHGHGRVRGQPRPRTVGRAPMTTPALDLTGLTKRYDNGFLALDGFALEV